MTYVFGPLGDWDMEHSHTYEGNVEVLDGARWRRAAQLVNAWEWLPTTVDDQGKEHRQGGENPYRHEAGWVPLADGMCIQVIWSEASQTWLLMKCEMVQLTAKELNAKFRSIKVRRSVPARFARNPHSGGRYELTWMWLEPLEMWVSDNQPRWRDIDQDNGDIAVTHAEHWAQELRTDWELEGEAGNYRWQQELLVEPDKLEWLKASVTASGEAVLDAALDRLAELEDVAREEAALGS